MRRSSAFAYLCRMGLVALTVVVAGKENQTFRTTASGVRRDTVDRTGLTWLVSQGLALIPFVCMVYVWIKPGGGTSAIVTKDSEVRIVVKCISA